MHPPSACLLQGTTHNSPMRLTTYKILTVTRFNKYFQLVLKRWNSYTEPLILLLIVFNAVVLVIQSTRVASLDSI
jgi:hypothetical protein